MVEKTSDFPEEWRWLYEEGVNRGQENSRAEVEKSERYARESLLQFENAEAKLACVNEAMDNFRDVILSQRGAIAENGMTNDQINDVLNEFDDARAAIKKATD